MKWMRRFCFGGMLLLALAKPADAAELSRVLLLHSFGPYFSPWNTQVVSLFALAHRILRRAYL